jgi:hypothetical protein
MILPLTNKWLTAHSEIWNNGYLVFGSESIGLHTNAKKAVLAHFGDRHIVGSLSGHAGHELLVTDQALRQIDISSAKRALVTLLEDEVRMFSSRTVESRYLEELATLFFTELGACQVYSNVHIYSEGERDYCLGPWGPVTRHSRDIFLCAVNDSCIGYWLHSDDE